MFVPPLAVRIAPYAGGVLLAVCAYLWAYGNGRAHERAKWEAAKVVAEREAAAKAAFMQAQVDAAGVALSQQSTEIDRLNSIASQKTKVYYGQNPTADVPCLSSERVRAVSEADRAAYAASTAAAGTR